jgi:periplasmic copper chaperone A
MKGKPMRHRTTVAGLALAAALLAPAAADAHVSLHPNVVPAGAFATLTLRVPNEQDSANTTGIRIQMPDGFLDVSAAPPPGWSFSTKTKKLATPVKTDDGEIDTEVTEVDFSGGKLPPGQFAQFPMSVVIPGKEGDVLSFKVLQQYSNGQVSRWIGDPDSDSPAPTIDVSAKGGPLVDIAGGEAGPPANAAASATPAATASAAPTAAATPAPAKSSSNGTAIAALIVAIIAALLGLAALLTRRRTGVPG